MDKCSIVEKDAVYKRVSKFLDPIIDKFPKEVTKNHMMVGGRGSPTPELCFYQPHNLRIYIDFQRFGVVPFNNRKYLRTTPKSEGDPTHKLINGTEHLIKGYKGCTFRIKKNQVEIYNYINHKQWFPIEMTTATDSLFIDIISNKIIEAIEVLKDLIKNCGGSSSFKILNITSEHKIQSENAIDMIDKKLVFHNKICKKVYPNQNNIEFKDPVGASNYLMNRAIENVAPEICKRIDSCNPLRALKNNVKCIDDIFVNGNLVKILTNSEKREFEGWIMQRFGIHA